jgi:hypothetical protein
VTAHSSEDEWLCPEAAQRSDNSAKDCRDSVDAPAACCDSDRHAWTHYRPEPLHLPLDLSRHIFDTWPLEVLPDFGHCEALHLDSLIMENVGISIIIWPVTASPPR